MRVWIAPEIGGAIHSWHRDTISLLREDISGTDDAIPARKLASFPLIPFSNRIARGQFNFDGVDYILPHDKKEVRHAMHGNALYAAWDIVKANASSAVLRLSYTPERQDMPFFPFSYEAEQIYKVSETSMRIGLKLRNTGARRFPAGFGHHLYFPRRRETLVKFEANKMWKNGDDGLPSVSTVKWREALAQGYRLDDMEFDNCFEEWSGESLISFPMNGYSLHIKASSAFSHCVLFTPADKPFFAFEPTTHLNDAVSRRTETTLHGLEILEPSELLEGDIIMTYLAS